MAFFSPHRGYAANPAPGAQVTEFKQMVRALHQAGIEVILDVVFNHTCEGNELGPTLSFKGLENRVYYMLTDDGAGYRNYTGCGNTVNGNHPILREFIFNCLRSWVLNYHVDGFRFDLATILSRGRRGELLPNPPIIERIAEDPVLADTKIIAEAWDAAGAYQVGSFPGGRWAEWNGMYRDEMRKFWRGDPYQLGAVATRLTGSSDLYQGSGRRPFHSINFITSHDGFPLNDLVSYNDKHNEANGEHNRDGDNNNYCYNYGVEGPTRSRLIEALRQRQIKNMLSSMFLSLGVPMLLAGDECRRTQRGNNNAYCQDNDTSWFNWDLVKKNTGLIRFVRSLIAFRRQQPTVRRTTFLTGRSPAEGLLPDVSWFDVNGKPMDWSSSASSMTCIRGGTCEDSDENGVDLAIFMHAGSEPQKFNFPEMAGGRRWKLFIDTAADSPRDIFPDSDGPPLPAFGRLLLAGRSLLCYVGEPQTRRRG
jgi:isoamylase